MTVIDLMLIGSVVPSNLALPLRKGGELLGRDINPTVYSLAEFQKKQLSKDHFLTAVLNKPKLFAVGSHDELAKITG